MEELPPLKALGILAPLPGCDKESGDKTPGIASLNPGLLSKQPSGLRFARRGMQEYS
jgi:hypothetical protein